MATPMVSAGASGWRERVKQLGLDPDIDAHDNGVLRTTRSLAEYTAWFNHPPHPYPEASDLTPQRLAKMPDALFRRHVVRHVTGEVIISDPSTIRAIEDRTGYFYAFFRIAAVKEITGKNPLIINSNNVITVYDEVLMKDGGYIKILVPCSFQCRTLTKQQGGSGPAADFDVFVVGEDGRDAAAGITPPNPGTAKAGSDAECDCCGGLVKSNAQNGQPGDNGDDGKDAQNDGDAGKTSPDAVFTVTESLNSFITFLSQGGKGGRGGNGGSGAQGGTGGKGGAGTTCGGNFPSGAQGGKGGNGGNGGNASNGGPAGAGGTFKIWVPEAQVNNVNVTILAGAGGEKGIRGFRGQKGNGGDKGGSGGSYGPDGNPGASDGLDGQNGTNGSTGTVFVNGQRQSV